MGNARAVALLVLLESVSVGAPCPAYARPFVLPITSCRANTCSRGRGCSSACQSLRYSLEHLGKRVMATISSELSAAAEADAACAAREPAAPSGFCSLGCAQGRGLQPAPPCRTAVPRRNLLLAFVVLINFSSSRRVPSAPRARAHAGSSCRRCGRRRPVTVPVG